jgi:hypothetical protein
MSLTTTMELLNNRAREYACCHNEPYQDYIPWIEITTTASETVLNSVVEERKEVVAGHVARLRAMLSILQATGSQSDPEHQFCSFFDVIASHSNLSVFSCKLDHYQKTHPLDRNVSKLYVRHALRKLNAFEPEEYFKVKQTSDGFDVKQGSNRFEVKRTQTGYTAKQLDTMEATDLWHDKEPIETPLILEKRWIVRVLLDTASELMAEMYKLRDSIERREAAREHSRMFPSPPSLEEIEAHFMKKKRAREADPVVDTDVESQMQSLPSMNMRGHSTPMAVS